MIPKNRTTKTGLQICTQDCGTTAGPSEKSIFNMVGELVMSRDLKNFQSDRRIVIEENEALIYVKYCRLSSNGSSCIVSKVVLIVLLYFSA